MGIFNAAFLKLLGACIKFTNSFNYYFLLLPLGLYVSNYLARKVAADDTDFSTNDAIAAINEKRGISLISSLKSFSADSYNSLRRQRGQRIALCGRRRWRGFFLCRFIFF